MNTDNFNETNKILNIDSNIEEVKEGPMPKMDEVETNKTSKIEVTIKKPVSTALSLSIIAFLSAIIIVLSFMIR